MQKFVVKKISRSTNITIAADEPCGDHKSPVSEDLEMSSIKMCGYLKKKRNRVGGWNKLYFVLQNSLLMSYNSKDEYEKKLVSFKDVICLIPGNTVLIPSLEPRFTIASNLNTFYTFRCDDNKICSKWITAILECLARDVDFEGGGKKPTACAFRSQQNLSPRPKPIARTSHNSWENLPTPNWIVNHNGRILLELNYMNCNRAKLPIAAKTAKILQNCTDNDVITTTKKVNFIQNDENQNFIRNADHNELRKAYDQNSDQFRLHNDEESKKRQSKEVDQISKMFGKKKSESQRPGNVSQCNGNDEEGNAYSEIGIEVQTQQMSFEDETGEYSSIYNGNYQSVDSKMLNNKLSIENLEDDTYAEIEGDKNVKFVKNISADKTSDDSGIAVAVYASVDMQKKQEARREKTLKQDETKPHLQTINSIDGDIYEDVSTDEKVKNDESNIYELIDIPLRPTRKSRSLVWKNWSRMHLFDFTKRFRESSEELHKPPSPDTISKRQKASLTLSDLSKRFNYRSMRNKARKMCSRNNSALATSGSSEQSPNDVSSTASDKAA